ncbi:trifunctional serine/threonine-protein kinase/ATP-binding protein/sensor histidine kinase [Bradyrhizobium sp. CB2312]|uniref:trifunctional serine/threonine-protein kinase/ATP-binding protein/sensor histidine kinase n=1 Tax=Bradyrhizobium sp. CB2312 TaxID=3039155 RepID=UPI0024B2001D|nr:trifunctional serine/threonine-protein kinase/ATP-binding protein/sensor histidine kinase [Bradyrhizobium sp. CB2312]WFU74110.1 AAA family ATPase [Bradyrhizobium sp. CB2312]
MHEYSLGAELDPAWAAKPLAITRHEGRTILLLKDPGGQPLDRILKRDQGQPLDLTRFLSTAIGLARTLGQVHQQGLIHKDIKPANVLVDDTGNAWLTGFGIASKLTRERQSPEPPEFIAGTLAYMAPEQTGRMNRSVDSRSDLYSLGVTFYEMLTGSLPFAASDPMEWVHCHIAKQPAAPSERVGTVPASVSAITMKLLSKTAEERYQTAAGVESDLRRCLSQWESQGSIDDFTPGAHDTPDRLMIPEKLYGRVREVDALLTAFDRIVGGGRVELVLVSGYSGIGKSAVVNELHKPLVPPRGLFASGKSDQYKRDIPHASLAQAFQSLVRRLLSQNEEDLRKWQDALREALGPNGLLLVDLVPELRHVIGEQPRVPELPPQEAQRRFQIVFRRFIGVFARPEHPLALFLDDMQWLDVATLDLLEDLLTRNDLQHLLIIGAYRDNEVNATHPLLRKLEAIRQAGAAVQDIVLTPLSRDDLGKLIVDSLHCQLERGAPLADLIHEKTSGNPFFAIQFISTLADDRLLKFDYRERRWVWDLLRIRDKGFTDNVVELMVEKLKRLPPETQKVLQQFACMGNSAEFEMLRIGYQGSVEHIHDHLWEAVRSGLIFRADNSYRFLHDRVQEAAYSLIPKELRAEAHLRIGMLLAEHTPAEKREEAIFEIVNQLNRGSHLITLVEDRERVAELNLIAGRRAKLSTAYDSALKYLRAGRALLEEGTWKRNHQLIFSIEYLTAECELLTVTVCLAAGDPLAEVQKECENGLASARRARFGLAIERCEAQLGLILTLRGLTATFGCLDHEGYSEIDTERRLAKSPDLVLAEFYYWTRKLQAHFFAGDLASAVDASLHAEPLLWTSAAMFESAEYRLYGALAHAAVWDHATPEERPRHFDSVLDHYRQLQMWTEANPETFEDRATLVGAEIARLEGQVQNAQELYDKAIREAHKQGFVHNQAIANEIAGRFYAERGYEKIAATYLRAARACYLRWGADGKVRQLEELYPHLKVDKSIRDSAATIVTPIEQLDLATVLRVSEAVSGEIVFEKLINTLMSSAIEHAGADRGLLILSRDDKYQIEAEATTSSDNVNVVLKQARVTAADLPESVFHYVLRTKESVLLHDASSQSSFSADAYIRDHRSRSVLCLPILKQTRLIGMLYLENNFATAAFTPTRMVVLTLLASQAAISIENASLYRELAEREARIRRLVDANIIGIFVWDRDDRIIDANEAFLRIVGYDRDDLVSGRLRWRDLTPTEWRDADDRRVAELEATGTVQPYEKEYFLKNGSRVPVLVGAATFGGRHDQGVAFVVDLTQRKRAEEEIRESERRYSEVQMELVHANRVATMGQLSASIAHEVNQPIGATLNNASAALHWLSKEPADLEKARQALNRIFANGNRVSEIVGRMRALFKKAPLRKEDVDINGAILEVIALTRGEVEKNGIVVQSHLVDGLPLIQGDRVQMQQVIMNLIINAIEALSSICEGARELVITTAKSEPDGVLVEVRDSGPGLSSADLERVFDAFNTTKPGGLGMGLSICRTIIEAHGGRLWATAAEPRGASFRFTLPAQSNRAA